MPYAYLAKLKCVALIAAAAVALAGCATPTEQDQPMDSTDASLTLTGNVFYRERIALTPGHSLNIVLREVSSLAKLGVVVAETSRQLDGEQVPLPFSLAVQTEQLVPEGRYVLRVFVNAADGQLEWASAEVKVPANPAASQNLGNLLLLRAADTGAAVVASGQIFRDVDLLNRTFRIEDIAGRGVIDNSNVTVRFGSDGQLTGSGGCNQYFGPYTRDASIVEIGATGATERACAPALMNQEGKFFRLLARVISVHRDRHGAIVLTTDDGHTLRGFESQASAQQTQAPQR